MEPEVTGMTERAMFCMLPEKEGGCDETENLVPIHYKVLSEADGTVLSDQILGWLCKAHALQLNLRNQRGSSEL